MSLMLLLDTSSSSPAILCTDIINKIDGIIKTISAHNPFSKTPFQGKEYNYQAWSLPIVIITPPI